MVSAQTYFKLNPNPRSEPLTLSENDTLKILAVMVEFQQDNDGNTFGNGKFGSIYSKDYGNTILDPLPHNAAYFESHLEFARNYFGKVSDGIFNISYTVFPNIITVSKTIRDYSPPPRTDDFSGLGDFAQEVWQLADQTGQIDFSEYDMFTIFNAGVGREIPTPGSIGLERDIPSLYLSESSFKNIFGDSFNGFPVNNGSFFINNTAILPSTENREIESFGQVYLQEFTINGLIVGTIASHIGLPDLFNTETGTSAIGRFGLMDGQALFAYSGLFPPEPSAWEKVYLGWITPKTLSIEDQRVNLTTYQSAAEGDDVLIKIPINSNEYYLIENRKRDANKDGITLTYKIGSAVNTIRFDKDIQGFSPFGADTLIGVVIDVDEYDWALPGFLEMQSFDDPFEDVGFIIWHIDEEVIRNNIASNTINNDRSRLGVKVVEADGIFDIGEEFTTIFGETVIGEGTKQDTWYSGNPSKFYTNKFNANTKPAAISNLGANSLVDIREISGIGNEMSFKVSFTNAAISKLAQKKLNIDTEIKSVFGLNEVIAVQAGNDIHLYVNEANEIEFSQTISGISDAMPSVFNKDGRSYIFGSTNNTLKVVTFTDGNIVSHSLFETTIAENITSPIVINENGNTFDIYLGSETGNILKYNFDENATEKFNLIETFIAFNNVAITQIVYNPHQRVVFAIAGNQYWNSVYNQAQTFSNHLKKLSVTHYVNDDIVSSNAVLLDEANNFLILPLGVSETKIEIKSAEQINDFLLADLKNDRRLYFAFSHENLINAKNLSGFNADYFPTEVNNRNEIFFGDYNLSIKIDNNDYADVISFDENGLIYAVDGDKGNVIPGFPISSGSRSIVHPFIFNSNGVRLALINEDKELIVWGIENITEVNGWVSKYANNYNNAFVEASSQGNVIKEFFPKDKAYNWPNPVYGDETNIRFFVNENSSVVVKIFDLAGDFVAELNGNATGGVDNELTWNVQNIQSGVYLAHLNVESVFGKSDNKIIKIAVIK